jgi:hypothetical protein
MKNVYTLISAAAVAAVMAAPVAAQELPLNNVVSGGQGNVVLDGQGIGLGIGAGLGGGVGVGLGIAAATFGLGIAAEAGKKSTSTGATS